MPIADILSIQLYTLRSLHDLGTILDIVAAAGFRNVEGIGSHLDDAANMKAKLETRGLKFSSSHVGLAALREQKRAGVKRRLAGFRVLTPRTVARPGHAVYLDGQQVDVVRSGTVPPTANCAVGLTYIPLERAHPGTQVEIDVRGSRTPAELVKLPFVPHRTRRATAAKV